MGEQNITCMDERVILGNGVCMCEHIYFWVLIPRI